MSLYEKVYLFNTFPHAYPPLWTTHRCLLACSVCFGSLVDVDNAPHAVILLHDGNI